MIDPARRAALDPLASAVQSVVADGPANSNGDVGRIAARGPARAPIGPVARAGSGTMRPIRGRGQRSDPAGNGKKPDYCSASWTFPTILAPGSTSVLSPSSFHLDGQTSFAFFAM